ncbi:MAG: D-threonate 4-phosphate dehydrogenase [Phycisphaerae bacterium]|nr:D-threonate 4-phosphate dehydrogenase [Phycisphaerae bacterium]
MDSGDGQRKPVVAITMGEPAGIGAEVTVKALADPDLRRLARFVVYGMNEQLTYAADLAEIEPFWWRVPPGWPAETDRDVVVVDYDEYSILSTSLRQPSKIGGEASMRFCEDAIAAVQVGQADALVTGPISKESWKLADFPFPGHTELLAKRCRTRQYAMMFAGGPLRVALATIHEQLFEIRNKFTIGCVYNPIELLDAALRDWFDLPRRRIAVCGLNPHASENGQFGDEEARIISPAITMARENGIDVEGPFPADTLFWRAAQGQFDGVVAMYHDQGLIPIKLLAFDDSVNLTLGLGMVRTSVDHGTAFDIVGRNRANPGSMKAAIRMAVDIAARRIGRQG